jgi:hypothetical protein
MDTSARRLRGSVLAPLLVVVLLAAGIGFAVYFFYCPCERTPGGWLLGDVVEEPVRDWSFANAEPLCQIQLFLAGIYPHAINLNCMASEGRLYLSCASCEGKLWSTAALAYPGARLRVGDDVYPVRLSRVEDPDELDQAWRARARKTGGEEDAPRQEGWWSFRVVSRGGAG